MKNIVIVILIAVVAGLGYAVLARNDNSGSSSDNATNSSESSGNTGSRENTRSLANSGLETVPQSAFEDDSITTLDISDNNLTGALPAEIRKLSNLEVLDASDNNLTGIPAEIGQLSKLRTADFSNNDISGLPVEIGNLGNLQTLDLRGNPNVSQQDLTQVRAKIPNANILTD
jgi:Leucine-rich repeat (LRR) protein